MEEVEQVDSNARREIDAAKQRMLERLGDAIAADAARYAPVRTGHLRDSIHAEPAAGDSVRVVADVDYAGYVELGTRHMAPHPYLRPALLREREAP